LRNEPKKRFVFIAAFFTQTGGESGAEPIQNDKRQLPIFA